MLPYLQEVGDQRCAQDGAANDAQVHLIRQRQRVVRGGHPGVCLGGSLRHLAMPGLADALLDDGQGLLRGLEYSRPEGQQRHLH